MARKAVNRNNPVRRIPAAPKAKTPAPPNFPQHELPVPFARLQTLGDVHEPEPYEEMAAALNAGTPDAAAKQLLTMVLDDTYYDYYDFYPGEKEYFAQETRFWTPTHALRTLARLGSAAEVAIEPLIALLDSEDDWFREELPFFFAAVGEPAIAPLIAALQNPENDEWQRIGAGDSLAEIGEAYPALKPQIIPALEQVVSTDDKEPLVVGFCISNLLDLDARDSLPLIEQAFLEERVDDEVLDMRDVREHFGLSTEGVTGRKTLAEQHAEWEKARSVPSLLNEDEDDEVQTPYVAAPKVGRNDPCPCGSGKKYKKCHGA